MRYYLYITILAMIFGLFGCKNNQKKDFVFDEFKSQIKKHGMKIDSVDETELIYISQGELNLQVSLANVRRNYERDKDPTHISDLVETLVTYNVELPIIWADAKNNIYISLCPNDFEFNDFLHKKITDEFSKVYIHSGNDKLTWISADDLKKWNITEKDLDKQANNNADELLAKTPIICDTIENHKLGLIEVGTYLIERSFAICSDYERKNRKGFRFPFLCSNSSP